MSRVFQGCRILMAAARAATKAPPPPPPPVAKAVKPKPVGLGIQKPVPVSPALCKFLGVEEISRAETVKKIWEHIKLHQLQVSNGAARAATKAPPPPPPPPPAAKAVKPKPVGLGIQKPVPVSPALCKFLGVEEISRAETVKKIWEHIKLHQLQNPANKREIRCDEKLKSIFEGKDTVGMMEIAKLLSPHFVKA